MGRGVTRKQTEALLDLAAKKLPHGAIRTAFIASYRARLKSSFKNCWFW